MDKTTQGLKTLAEYMGLKAADKKSILDYEDDEVSIHSLTYDTSWDALVPVYSKIYCTEENLFNAKDAYNIVSRIDAYIKYDNKQAAFEAVVELVTLINKENGK